jgi:hypothetical protein
MKIKTCEDCKNEFETIRALRCPDCAHKRKNAQKAKYVEENRERVNKLSLDNYNKNKDVIRQKQNQYKKDNKEEVSQKRKEYYNKTHTVQFLQHLKGLEFKYNLERRAHQLKLKQIDDYKRIFERYESKEGDSIIVSDLYGVSLDKLYVDLERIKRRINEAKQNIENYKKEKNITDDML